MECYGSNGVIAQELEADFVHVLNKTLYDDTDSEVIQVY